MNPHAAAPPTFSDAVLAHTVEPAAQGLTPGQRVVYALAVRTFSFYRDKMAGSFWAHAGLIAFLALFGLGFCVVVMLVSYWVLYVIGLAVGGWSNSLLYVVPALVLLLVFAIRLAIHESGINFQRLKNDQIDRINWGRLNDIVGDGALEALGLFLGGLVGLQTGLLYFTTGHCGLEFPPTFWGSFVLTLDNVMHGIFLDCCEMYHLHLGDPIHHHFFSASVFLGFRLGYDVTVLLLVYVGYRRFTMRNLFQDFPAAGDVPKLADWLEKICSDGSNRVRQFPDEFLFVMLVEEYLRGNYELVRQLTHQFPHIKVLGEVRDLFVDPSGAPLFEAEATAR